MRQEWGGSWPKLVWLPVLAAARLNERIPVEETALLRLTGAESNTGYK